jgi:hypothetical protein
MQKQKLKSKMVLHGDNNNTLAAFLCLSRSRFSEKINEKNGAEFKQREIMAIKTKYSLTADEVDDIFFTKEVS